MSADMNAGTSKTVINDEQDLQALLAGSELVLINTYRGKWCPFCRSYLGSLDKVFRDQSNQLKIYGVSVDEVDENAELKAKLGIGFDLLQDASLLFHHQFAVHTGKGHGKEAYLQPAVFLFHNGEKVYEWIQTPSLLNMGGATSRVSVKKVLAEVNKHR